MCRMRNWYVKLASRDVTFNRDAIQTPTKFFDSIIKEWYNGVPQVRRFVSSCNNRFDKACELGGKRLCGKGLATN
jgi:hypothetical protein